MTAMKSGMHVSLLVSIHFYCLYHIFIIVFVCLSTFSALTLLVGWQEGHPARKMGRKNMGLIFFYGPDALPATQPTVSKH